MLSIFLTGLFTGLGLILAIGAQNAFVIRQGLLRQNVFVVAAVSSVCDALLIAVGVAGLGAVIASSTWLTRAAAWGGGAFLIWFGLRALHNALRRDHKGLAAAEAEMTAGGASRKAAATSALGFSLLNPHVYLDTVVLMGGIGAQYAWDGRLAFLTGGAVASFLFFFTIAYGAMLFTPLFRKPITTRLLDGFVAVVMVTIAVLLLTGELGGNG
ncbi:MAG: LysE/ArgO family amino acid transporter [Alphaproteobacteria bacterium]|nr:LysE/ArgO family amino acid transporter [Alphaproteobacteria bacterium]